MAGEKCGPGRLFNALAVCHHFKQCGDEVRILFLGTGTRWPAELARPEHPVHGLFNLVRDKVAGVSQGCAEVFGTADETRASELPFLNDNPVPGTAGLPSVSALLKDGFHVLVY